MAGFFERHSNVYLYIPNLIGYARIAFTLYSFHVAFTHPVACVATYFFGFVCDELDGRAARAFGQSSTLGALLDMVTDRVSTAGLLAVLTALYPSAALLWLGLLMLDVFSHWFQMYAALAAGAETHKDVRSRSLLVRTYYANRLFMGFCCVCCEVMYLAIYLLHWPRFQTLGLLRLPPRLLAAVPPALAAALPPLAALRRLGGVPAVGVVAALALPGVVTKQTCNWLQLRTAAAGLVEYDARREGRGAKAPAKKSS
ncbi:MAG: phosphatidylinositol synthase [Monoraphidium minutum]|nr:MAG: phosphatidylinositol synthase [Monoraphidium minutum]